MSDSPPQQRSNSELRELIRRATEADGSPPFSDGALVDLANGERELVWERDAAGAPVGAALDSPTASEFVVHPEARGNGYGARLLDMLVHPSRGGVGKLFWAHGDHPGARALARHHGLDPVRTLLHLRGLVGGKAGPAETSLFTLDDFTLDDADALLDLNARAFADHPEQGALSRADLDVLMAQPWFDTADLLLLRDGADLVGFCWLKVESGLGEFYVVGVDPERQGEGLGRRLVSAGMARLAERGIPQARLYVEADNAPALRLYRSFGFRDDSADVQYAVRSDAGVHDAEEVLHGGSMTAVSRVGDSVRRTARAGTPTIHALLDYLRDHGVTSIPRPLGFDEQGREKLSFMVGVAPTYPMPEWVWSEDNLRATARMLRRLHDAAEHFPRQGATWNSPAHSPDETICHNDFAPYNLTYVDGRLSGVIDFDEAAPGPRIWDVAYLAYRVVPLSASAELPFDQDTRARRLADLLAAYGAEFSAAEVLATAIDRLEQLARFSDDHAVSAGRPDLHDHAALYRADAAALRG